MSECVIKGPQNRLNWLVVSAFRYCVCRHRTQAMWGVEDVILGNIDVLHTEFIRQFIRDIKHGKSAGTLQGALQGNGADTAG